MTASQPATLRPFTRLGGAALAPFVHASSAARASTFAFRRIDVDGRCDGVSPFDAASPACSSFGTAPDVRAFAASASSSNANAAFDVPKPTPFCELLDSALAATLIALPEAGCARGAPPPGGDATAIFAVVRPAAEVGTGGGTLLTGR